MIPARVPADKWEPLEAASAALDVVGSDGLVDVEPPLLPLLPVLPKFEGAAAVPRELAAVCVAPTTVGLGLLTAGAAAKFSTWGVTV